MKRYLSPVLEHALVLIQGRLDTVYLFLEGYPCVLQLLALQTLAGVDPVRGRL